MKTHLLIEPLEARIAPALTAFTVDLGGLTGGNGFSINGAVDLDEAGTSVSNAGDVNGDGFDDVIVGARFADEGGSNRGAAYVIFGTSGPGAFPAAFDLGSLGERGFEIKGVGDNDFAGQSVHAAGDVNGDGFDDLIIGAQYADEGGNNRGAAYVVFGHAGYGPDVTLATLNGTDGFKLQGVNDGDNAGRAVSTAGDINHDGYADLLIGAPAAAEGGNSRGAAYVVFGQATWAATLKLGALNTSTGFKVPGISNGQMLGTSLSGAGDVNGDGFDDIIIGSPFAPGGGTSRGESYVIFGKSTGFGTSFDIATLNGGNGFTIRGAADGDQAGGAVSGAGDINGDGFADVTIGAQFTGGVNDIGTAYVVFGKGTNFATPLSLGGLTGSNGFSMLGVTKNTGTGSSVSGAGDVNGDGYDDLIVGADNAGGGAASSGVSYLVYGMASGFTSSMPLTSLDVQHGLRLTGIGQNDASGHSVSNAGDINGDGYADVIIGAAKADAGGAGNRGSAYVVFGGATGTQVAPTFSGDHKTATFTDLDGDRVTVKVSKGQLNAAQFDLLQPAGADGARFLGFTVSAGQKLGDVTITAKATAAGGDGLVELGYFNSDGFDLGAVKIAGNVERLKVGDGVFTTPAMKTLTVQSVGRAPLPAQDTGGKFTEEISGAVGAIVIKGNLDGARLDVGPLGSINVGGSIIGGLMEYFGGINSSGNVGSVKIGHDLIGAGHNTGYVNVSGTTKSISVGGSIVGGADKQSGTIYGAVGIGSVVIGHDVRDGSIGSNGNIGKVTIGGSLLATISGKITVINSQRTLGPVLVKGDIKSEASYPVLLVGRGTDQAGAKTDIGIAGVTVLGSVTHASFLAGYDGDAVAVDARAQIGKVSIGGDWTASSIACGVKIGAADFDHFGNADDALSAGGQSSAIGRIASIVIKGAVNGTAGGSDHYGFVAHEIGALQIGAVKYALKKSTANQTFALGSTPDFKLLEV